MLLALIQSTVSEICAFAARSVGVFICHTTIFMTFWRAAIYQTKKQMQKGKVKKNERIVAKREVLFRHLCICNQVWYQVYQKQYRMNRKKKKERNTVQMLGKIALIYWQIVAYFLQFSKPTRGILFLLILFYPYLYFCSQIRSLPFASQVMPHCSLPSFCMLRSPFGMKHQVLVSLWWWFF